MKKNLPWIFGSIVLMLLMLVTHSDVMAQDGVTIKGNVADERGSFVRGAEVRLNSRTGFFINTETDSNGVYSFSNVKSGSYIIEVNAPGFASTLSEEIV